MNRENSQFVYIKRRVPEALASRVEALNVRGIYTREIKTRYYPHGAFLCHVLGFQNHEGVGSAGIEQANRAYLKGSPGYIESKKDGLRKELFHKRERYIAPKDGHDICLTIDQYIQDNVETVLDEVMVEHNAKGAWAIVQNVRTGEILAMASRPDYDPNDFTTSTPEQRMNRAISFNFEPGSTLKVIPFALALENRLVNPSTIIDTENGSWYYAKHVLRDYHGYTRLSVADVLKKSSNIGTAKLALMLGDRELERAMRSFGLGRDLGIGLPGEERGILHPHEKWSKFECHPIVDRSGCIDDRASGPERVLCHCKWRLSDAAIRSEGDHGWTWSNGASKPPAGVVTADRRRDGPDHAAASGTRDRNRWHWPSSPG